MKKIFTLCVVLCLSYLSMGATNLKHEFRATWLTTAWGNDWPKTKATSDATRKQQQDELVAIFDRLQAGNMNAVCLQVRGRSDAFYQSSYEPWAAELAGARGKDPGYDPLAFAIEEAHKRGLELHAWVNPFRVTSAGTLDANDLVKKNAGQWIIQYNNGSFTGEIIDPGYPEAREYVLNVLMEIISNYDIDGIVMDDYFYPYGGTTTEDATSKALYKPANVVDVNQNGDTDDDWRRSNVDVFLKELYDRIQAKKPWVRFGMGTFGIWTTQTKVAQAYGISLPSGISGLDDYDVQACNPVEWVKNGYVDYINPQLYWPTTSTGQNYNKLCQWWAKDVCEHFSNQLTNGKKVHFFSSQSISANPTLSEIQSEIDVNRNNLSSGSTGSVFFDTDAYLTMDNALMTSRFATHALPLAMDWKSNTALAAPTNLTVSGSTLSWQHATAGRFTVYVYPKGTAWSTAKNDPSYLQGVIYGNSMDISGIDTNANDIAVCAYDRFGVEHEGTIYSNESGTVNPPASGTITYELNGGMMNEFGWTSKNDMFQACMADCGVTTLPSLDEIKATGNDAALTTICAKLSDVSGMLNFDKWDWLEQYIMEVQNAQAGTSIGAGSVSVLTAGVTSAIWRYALAAFFIEGQRTTWPYSADFSQAGKDEAYIPAWKHVYTNPTSVTTEFTLYDPCREGYTFLGWYANADFSGEKVTTINAETTGTLYAKWINSDWIITYTSTDGNIVTPNATDVFGANIVSNIYENGVGTITFDGPVTSIGDCAFLNRNFLYSITIPNRVTSLGDDAFCCCGNLTSIFIPNSVAYIESGVFSSCTSLASIVVEDNNEYYDNRNNCNAIIETKTNTLVAGCKNTIIPNSVTRIGDEAFNGCEFLPFISIPNSVTSIGSYAFYGCSSLTSITIPNSVTSIGMYAFYDCRALTSMVIDSDNNHYDSRENCNAIIETATNTLISGCQNTIIPSSVTSIGARAFSLCNSLTSITIPNSVISIWDEAFEGCSGLTSITIPNSVTSIGNGVFSGCSKLNTIHVEATIPPALANSTVFMNTPAPVCVIPCGSLAAYEVSDWASQVGSFVEDCSAKITYELNGGVTNDYGWMSKDDMYHELLVDINAIIPTTRVDVDTVTLAYDKTKNIQKGIPTYWDDLSSLLIHSDFLSKWGWLINYMDSACASESKYLPSTLSVYLRYNLSAFFFEKEYTSWPQTPDYSKYGLYPYYQPAWQHAYDNPTNSTEEFILNAPYREGYTFAGWYTNADLSGEKITIVEAETNDTLYAKWIENSLVESTWKVLYTSTNGGIVAPNAIDVFGANIVSNTYENGVGTITFDGPVTSIGTAAFHDCLTLKSITIPNSVNSIGVQAFCDCSAIDSLTIPENVNSISGWAFIDCSSLLSIVVAQENMTYDSRENCNAIIETATNTLIVGCKKTIIPNGVVTIGEHAFRISSLAFITIPNSVTNIERLAFFGSSIDTIYVEATTPPALEDSTVFMNTPSPICVIPCGTLAAYQASDWASQVSEFVEEGCIDPTWQITYTSTDGNIVTPYATDVFGANIVSNTYENGVGTITFDGPVTSIGDQAFLGCSSLTSVTLLNSVTSIGDHAFYQCTSLTSITLPNSVTRIGNGAFEYSSLTSITLPNSVTSIGDMAFSGCDSLISIVVEDGNATYDSRTNCNAIIETATNTLIAGCQNTIIPNSVTSIGSFAFFDRSSLTSITIPNSVTSIGSYAFGSCSSLTSITIPNNVTTIGKDAFWGCKSLTSITIPNSVTSIGSEAFSYCPSLTSIVVASGNPTYDSRENCNAIINTATNTLIAGCQNTIIPNSVTSIGSHAFSGCSSLTSITIPNSVTSIGDMAFSGCDSLTSITIPNSVTSIGERAFRWCSSLTSITIPNSVTSIGETAFGWCSSLTSLTIPNSVTSIGEGAFDGCTSLTSITIPESVTSIGNYAFDGCSSLDTIYVEATTPPALEDSTVFMNTPAPVCVIPCGTLAAYEASDWAKYVSEFVEEGCAPIQMCGDDLYWEYADGLLTITGTGEMYDYAADTDVPWYDVRGNIKTVSLPDAMTKIGKNAFYKCTAMTSINMPTSLTAIGEKAFAQDTKLACEIILPASMTTIASRAFFNCQAVTAFHIEATTPPTISNDAFERTTAPIHVPCGYGHVYGKHAQWGELNLEMCELLQDNVYYYPIDGHTARAVTYHSNPTDTIVIPSAVVIDGMPRTVTEVADFAFADCANLPAIYFNEGLEYIGERAFVRCYGLQGTIVLPATLETIGERAFSYCNNVDRYTIQAMTPPVLGANAFTGDNKNALFYISCEAMDDYKVATNWSSLKSRLRDACLNIYHYNTALGANGVHTTEDTLVASIYYRRQFTTSRWETLYLPFEVDRVTVLEDGVEYDLNAWSIFSGGHYYLAKPYGIENKEIVFGFTQVVDAHTPYIIQFKEPYYHDKMITFHGKESWNKLNTSFEALPISFEMQMAGNTTLQDQILEEPVYMLRASSNFILQNTTTTLHPFECYVIPSVTSSGAPARMSVRFRGDVPTAVESVKGNESHLTYSVDGYTLTVYPQGQAFSIYSLNGALIYSCEAGKEAVDCELNSGCYLLHAGAEAHKIML